MCTIKDQGVMQELTTSCTTTLQLFKNESILFKSISCLLACVCCKIVACSLVVACTYGTW